MPRYTALEPIEHDGKRFEPGVALSLSQEHAAPLLALRHIEPAAKVAQEPSVPASTAQPTASGPAGDLASQPQP